MPDRINTTMKRVEAVGANAAVGSSLRDAGLAQLLRRDDAVLASGETGNEAVRIRFVELVPHVRNQVDNPADFAPLSLPVFVPTTPERVPARPEIPIGCTFPRRWRPNAH